MDETQGGGELSVRKENAEKAAQALSTFELSVLHAYNHYLEQRPVDSRPSFDLSNDKLALRNKFGEYKNKHLAGEKDTVVDPTGFLDKPFWNFYMDRVISGKDKFYDGYNAFTASLDTARGYPNFDVLKNEGNDARNFKDAANFDAHLGARIVDRFDRYFVSAKIDIAQKVSAARR